MCRRQSLTLGAACRLKSLQHALQCRSHAAALSTTARCSKPFLSSECIFSSLYLHSLKFLLPLLCHTTTISRRDIVRQSNLIKKSRLLLAIGSSYLKKFVHNRLFG